MIINVKEILSTNTADNKEKGEKIFNEIKSAVASGSEMKEIIIDFDKIDLVNTAFLNDAIGQLFNKDKFDLSKISVKVVHMNENMRELVHECIVVAQQKYSM